MRRARRHRADELGAHVSTAGGLQHAPARAALLGAQVLQLFTKQPGRWAERQIDPATAKAFRRERRSHNIRWAAAHDAYLINLASPDPQLFERSFDSFRAELERCSLLHLDALVTHPGNATDGDAASAVARNAAAVERALVEVPGDVCILFETTAGSGRVLGHRFEQIAELIDRVAQPWRSRVGVCLDTCHVWAAGYDLRGDYHAVFREFDDVIGLDRLRLFHLNDALSALGSRWDRHAEIGHGCLGHTPFRLLMNDTRFLHVPKLLETPKGDDALVADRRNLRRLRRYRTARSRTKGS